LIGCGQIQIGIPDLKAINGAWVGLGFDLIPVLCQVPMIRQAKAQLIQPMLSVAIFPIFLHRHTWQDVMGEKTESPGAWYECRPYISRGLDLWGRYPACDMIFALPGNSAA